MIEARRILDTAIKQARGLYMRRAATLESLRQQGYDTNYATRDEFERDERAYIDAVHAAALSILTGGKNAEIVRQQLPKEWKMLIDSDTRHVLNRRR
jgi:hypothetical protein